MRRVKTSVVLFDGTFPSNGDGTAQRYLLSDMTTEERQLLGQATTIRLAVQTRTRSGNARLKMYFYETAGPRKPTALGSSYQPFYTGPDIDTDAPAPMNVVGPFCDNVDLALDVSASTGSQLETWDGTVTAVLFFDG